MWFSFWLCLGMLVCSLVSAETYSERPDILSLKPIHHIELGESWLKLKKAHLEAVAMIAEMYPDPNEEIYFLARDSEYLFDMMKVLAESDPSLLSRIHLLNISRSNMRASHVKDYLAQEGITEDALNAGKKIVFIDTGFSGTIPKTISEYYPEKFLPQIKTHLMSSSNPNHPSCRVFLTQLNPEAPNLDPGSMHGTVLYYEHMARFTERSSHFEKKNGRWDAVGKPGKNSDGKVSRESAKQYMEDLLAYSKESKKTFAERRAEWKKLFDLNQSENAEKLSEELHRLIKGKDPLDQAMARDFAEIIQTNLETKIKEKINFKEIGISPIVPEFMGGGKSNKLELIEKHPEWKHILENPASEIPKLFEDKELLKIGAIADSVKDIECLQILCDQLGIHSNNPEVRNLIRTLILKKDSTLASKMAEYTFSNTNMPEMKDLLKLLIENGDKKVGNVLARAVFSKPEASEMKDLVELLMKKEKGVWGTLAVYTFSEPHASKWKDLINELILEGGGDTQEFLIQYVLLKLDPVVRNEFFELLIKRGDQEVLRHLAQHTFSKPEITDMKDLLLLLIEKGNMRVLQDLAIHTFPKPHTADMKDLLKLLINKADNDVLLSISGSVFAEPHTAKWTDLIRMVIEKGDKRVLRNLQKFCFSTPHAKGPEYDIFRKAVLIEDQKTRIQFLETELGVLKTESSSNFKSLCSSVSNVLNAALLKVIGKGAR